MSNCSYFGQIFREKREKYRFELRKDRNDSIFNEVRFSFLQLPAIVENSYLSSKELAEFTQKITDAFNAQDNSALFSSVKSFKEVLLIKAIPSDCENILRPMFYQILSDLLLKNCDWVQDPSSEINQNILYIYVLFLHYLPNEGEKIVTIEGVSHLLILISGNSCKDSLFLIFEALSASCINEFFRDFIVKGDIVRKILDVLMGDIWFSDSRLIESIISLLKSCYIIKPAPYYEDMKYLFDPLVVILGLKNNELLIDILFILTKMAASNYEDFIKNSFENGNFAENLIIFLQSNDENLTESTLNVIAALTFGDAESNLQLYTKNIIPNVITLMKNEQISNNLRKKCLIILGNFFDGDFRHIQIGFDKNYLFFEVIMKINEKNYELQREIIHCLVNAIFSANNEQIIQIVELGALTKLVDVLLNYECEEKLSLAILEGIEIILMNGFISKTENNFGKHMEELNLSNILNKLLGHYNEKVGQAANKILEGYFNEEN